MQKVVLFSVVLVIFLVMYKAREGFVMTGASRTYLTASTLNVEQAHFLVTTLTDSDRDVLKSMVLDYIRSKLASAATADTTATTLTTINNTTLATLSSRTGQAWTNEKRLITTQTASPNEVYSSNLKTLFTTYSTITLKDVIYILSLSLTELNSLRITLRLNQNQDTPATLMLDVSNNVGGWATPSASNNRDKSFFHSWGFK